MASTKQTLMILFGFAAVALVGVGATFAIFIKLAETEFVAGKDIYLRDVYIVIDQTLSMAGGQRREAKDILKEEVLNVLGLGDRAFCYRIASDFKEQNDRVFNSPRSLPKVPENVPGASVAEFPEHLKSMLVARWMDFKSERDHWLENLEVVGAQGERYSDYLGTLEEIGRRINNSADPNLAQEKWLIIIGDLKHEPIMKEPPLPAREEKRSFAGVKVELVHPGGMFSPQEQQRIESFWRKYFSARGNQDIHFISYDGFIGRFPASKVPNPAAFTMK